MYVCGPTVYSSAHIGHARAAITFDVITRFLRKLGYKVEYARNYTDVDDKIINKTKEHGIPPEEVARIYTEEYKNDMFNLGVDTTTYEPTVSEHIPEIIDLIKTIIDKGYAYQSDGDVFFSIKMFRGYGKLSKRTPDEMLAGIRVDINEKKENPLDFALWKGVKPGEPWWESPWGKGRPGWHIECSAMSMRYLGKSFEIHGGGKDLIFPHHENEIAQSETALDESETALERLYIMLKRAYDLTKNNKREDKELATSLNLFNTKSIESMCDDFNTADTVGQLIDLVRATNRSIDAFGWTPTLQETIEEIRSFGSTLGILELEPNDYLKKEKLSRKSLEIDEEEINELIEERNAARKEKNWKRADDIRAYLDSKGITLEDTPKGTLWRVKAK